MAATQGLAPLRGEVYVFWDLENMAPRASQVGDTIKRMRLALSGFGPLSSINVYCDTTTVSKAARQVFATSGARLIDVPYSRKKETADKYLLVDMILTGSQAAQALPGHTGASSVDDNHNNRLVTVVLVSSDSDFVYGLVKLSQLGVRTVCIRTAHTSINTVELERQVDFILDWERVKGVHSSSSSSSGAGDSGLTCTPCWNIMRGKACKFGDSCRYCHDETHDHSGMRAQASSPTPDSDVLLMAQELDIRIESPLQLPIDPIPRILIALRKRHHAGSLNPPLKAVVRLFRSYFPILSRSTSTRLLMADYLRSLVNAGILFLWHDNGAPNEASEGEEVVAAMGERDEHDWVSDLEDHVVDSTSLLETSGWLHDGFHTSASSSDSDVGADTGVDAGAEEWKGGGERKGKSGMLLMDLEHANWGQIRVSLGSSPWWTQEMVPGSPDSLNVSPSPSPPPSSPQPPALNLSSEHAAREIPRMAVSSPSIRATSPPSLSKQKPLSLAPGSGGGGGGGGESGGGSGVIEKKPRSDEKWKQRALTTEGKLPNVEGKFVLALIVKIYMEADVGTVASPPDVDTEPAVLLAVIGSALAKAWPQWKSKLKIPKLSHWAFALRDEGYLQINRIESGGYSCQAFSDSAPLASASLQQIGDRDASFIPAIYATLPNAPPPPSTAPTPPVQTPIPEQQPMTRSELDTLPPPKSPSPPASSPPSTRLAGPAYNPPALNLKAMLDTRVKLTYNHAPPTIKLVDTAALSGHHETARSRGSKLHSLILDRHKDGKRITRHKARPHTISSPAAKVSRSLAMRDLASITITKNASSLRGLAPRARGQRSAHRSPLSKLRSEHAHSKRKHAFTSATKSRRLEAALSPAKASTSATAAGLALLTPAMLVASPHSEHDRIVAEQALRSTSFSLSRSRIPPSPSPSSPLPSSPLSRAWQAAAAHGTATTKSR